MKIKKFLMGLGLIPAMLFTACSNDEPGVDRPETDNGESFYATISLALPASAGSRSATNADGSSTEGEEYGKDYENNIQTIIVLLAKQVGSEYQIVAINQGDAAPSTNNAVRPSYTLRFKQNDIAQIAGQTIYPFVICNPTADLSSRLSSSATISDVMDQIEKGSVTLTTDAFGGWTRNNFTMTNATITAAVNVPSVLSQYNSPENSFALSTISNPIAVERSVARFDFQQYNGGNGLNKYTVNDANEPTEVVGYVTLKEMSLVNIPSEFYIFRRVSPDGKNPWTIGGAENLVNSVVAPNYNNLDNRTYQRNIFANGPANPALINDWTNIASLAGSEQDNWTSPGKYNIWRYATENAVPYDPASPDQKKKYTTGVVFKGNITFPAGSALEASTQSNTRNLYKYEGTIFGNYDDLKAEITRAQNTSLAQKAKDAGMWSETGGVITFVDESQINVAGGVNLADKGFTVYRPEAGQYNVYYYYWNRHNDNGNPAVTGPMEFSVVRNNVYKLYVNNINNFGHPGSPDDDPDTPDPDDPVEEVNMYFSLSVKVLPWTVRVNNIEF